MSKGGGGRGRDSGRSPRTPAPARELARACLFDCVPPCASLPSAGAAVCTRLREHLHPPPWPRSGLPGARSPRPRAGSGQRRRRRLGCDHPCARVCSWCPQLAVGPFVLFIFFLFAREHARAWEKSFIFEDLTHEGHVPACVCPRRSTASWGR